jgi:hypothetical protein
MFSTSREALDQMLVRKILPSDDPSSRPSGDGGNHARRLTRPHQPGAPRRDPARLARTSHRSTSVATNAPKHALHQNQCKRAGYQPRPDPDSRPAWRKISLANSPTTPAPTRFRNQLTQAKLEIPIDHHRSPAGSCLGGFRTPAPSPDARPAMAGVRKPSPWRSFRGTSSSLECRHSLKHGGSRSDVCCGWIPDLRRDPRRQSI